MFDNVFRLSRDTQECLQDITLRTDRLLTRLPQLEARVLASSRRASLYPSISYTSANGKRRHASRTAANGPPAASLPTTLTIVHDPFLGTVNPFEPPPLQELEVEAVGDETTDADALFATFSSYSSSAPLVVAEDDHPINNKGDVVDGKSSRRSSETVGTNGSGMIVGTDHSQDKGGAVSVENNDVEQIIDEDTLFHDPVITPMLSTSIPLPISSSQRSSMSKWRGQRSTFFVPALLTKQTTSTPLQAYYDACALPPPLWRVDDVMRRNGSNMNGGVKEKRRCLDNYSYPGESWIEPFLTG